MVGAELASLKTRARTELERMTRILGVQPPMLRFAPKIKAGATYIPARGVKRPVPRIVVSTLKDVEAKQPVEHRIRHEFAHHLQHLRGEIGIFSNLIEQHRLEKAAEKFAKKWRR
jgi:hypothetical protein